RPLLFRLCPRSLVEEGFGWGDVMPFSERYGRIEIVQRETTGGGDSNSMSRGSKTSTAKYCRPGIMPTLFGSHLIGNALFLGLEEMGDELPPLDEFVVGVPMDRQIALEYEDVEEKLRAQIRTMVAKGDK